MRARIAADVMDWIGGAAGTLLDWTEKRLLLKAAA
jgi:hypothetical protein